MIEININ